MKRTLFLSLGFAFAVLPACNDSTGVSNAPCDPFLLQYGAAVGDTVSPTGGVRYIDIETGTGAAVAEAGDLATVNFSGYVSEDLRFIDSSCGSNSAALAFQVGDQRYIAGFSDGVVGMRTGGVRRAFIPAHLGFTAQGSPYFGDDLIFDLHLVELN